MSLQPAAPITGRVVRNVVRGCLGNFIEWYDWFVYASFSIYFAATFFPKGNQTAQLLSAAVIFAVGFLLRPLGSWILGFYADRFGRRNALTLSVLMMGAGSLLIAVSPGYSQVGLLAPAVLVIARLLQGLSVGGEFGSSAAYLAEVATPGRRGFFSSFQYVSIIMGQLSALLVQIVLQQLVSSEQMYAWGWRVPFAIGAVMSIVVLYLRRGMDETDHYKAERARVEAATEASGNRAVGSRSGLLALMKYPRQFMAVLGLAIGGTVAFYTFTTYMQTYMVNTAGMKKETASIISFAALLIFMLLQPLAGAISDRIGRRKVMLFFSVGGTLLTVPIMTLSGQTADPFAAFGLMTLGLLVTSGYTALSAIVKAEMFPTHVRAIGVGLPHALVTTLFSSTLEPIALALKQAGIESSFFWYVTACMVITLVASVAVKDPSRNSTLEVGATAPERVEREAPVR